MNAQTVIETPLAKLREPFAPNHVSKLPKPTKAQTQLVRDDYKKGIRCKECGSWHHPEVVHLDYVGHAALTDRLLDTDIEWYWEPLAFTDLGLPAFDQTGGLWIKLTVAGVTRLGYGHAASKPNADPGAREKEVIGDALRNAAMRFGAALDLWHKGDLHAEEESTSEGGSGRDNTEGRQVSPDTGTANQSQAGGMPDAEYSKLANLLKATNTASAPILDWYKVKNLRLLGKNDYAEVIERLETRLEDMAKADSNKAATDFAKELGDEIPQF